MWGSKVRYLPSHSECPPQFPALPSPRYGQQARAKWQLQWFHKLLLGIRQSQTQAIDELLRNFGWLRVCRDKLFLEPDQQFDGAGPVKKVPQRQQINTRGLCQCPK